MAANKWKTGEKKLRMKEVSNVLNANCMNAFEFVFVYNLELMRTAKKKCFHWTKLFGSISFEGKLKCILCIGVEKKRSTFLHKNLEYIFCTRELCILNIIWNSELDVIKNNVAVPVRPHEKGASPQFHSISSMNTI